MMILDNQVHIRAFWLVEKTNKHSNPTYVRLKIIKMII